MYKRILVPTDGSPLSAQAVKNAIGLAASLGAELLALHVVPRYPRSYFEGASTSDPAEIARVEQQWASQGQLVADEAVCTAAKAGVQANALTVQSDLVAQAILEAAREHGCDLVVMASHGRKGLKGLLLGSETQHVLTHGNIPVLVLR